MIRHARERGLIVILDGKRGDIGSTAEAYAHAYLGGDELGRWAADALNGEPLSRRRHARPLRGQCRRTWHGVLRAGQNLESGSGQFQDLLVAADNLPLYRHVADYVERLSGAVIGPAGYGSIGAVVGATESAAIGRAMRRDAARLAVDPRLWQSRSDGQRCCRRIRFAWLWGALVNNSRGIIFAHARREYAGRFKSDHWQEAVAAATHDMIDQLLRRHARGTAKAAGLGLRP